MKKRRSQLPETPGIYLITSYIKREQYIGSSRNLNARKTDHLTSLKKGIHENPYLQNHYNKYGKDVFKFSILEHSPFDLPQDELLAREQYYIDKLNPEFNICKIAGSRPLVPIKQYDLNGALIATFPSITDAARETGIWQPSISYCINGKVKRAGTFIFKTGDIPPSSEELKLINTNKTKNGSVYQFNLNGVLIEVYPSIRQASKQTGINHQKIRYSIYNPQGTADNYFWSHNPEENIEQRLKAINNKYITKNTKPVYQYSLSTGKLIASHKSVAKAAMKTGLWESDIRLCTRGKFPHKGGFIFTNTSHGKSFNKSKEYSTRPNPIFEL